jgi:hypothetical protein
MLPITEADLFPLQAVPIFTCESSLRAAALEESDRIEMALILVALESLVTDLPGYLLPSRGREGENENILSLKLI